MQVLLLPEAPFGRSWRWWGARCRGPVVDLLSWSHGGGGLASSLGFCQCESTGFSVMSDWSAVVIVYNLSLWLSWWFSGSLSREIWLLLVLSVCLFLHPLVFVAGQCLQLQVRCMRQKGTPGASLLGHSSRPEVPIWSAFSSPPCRTFLCWFQVQYPGFSVCLVGVGDTVCCTSLEVPVWVV